jgi:hypothetical protein
METMPARMATISGVMRSFDSRRYHRTTSHLIAR